MRVMAIDLGTKRIGIAISDPLFITAQGIETYNRTTDEKDVEYIIALAKKLGAGTLLFGMPRNMNGTYGPQSEFVRSFAAMIQCGWDGAVEFFDERLTTITAQRVLIDAGVRREKRKNVIDKMAAVIILQGYMDMKSMQSGDLK